jgi:hypothetical protein
MVGRTITKQRLQKPTSSGSSSKGKANTNAVVVPLTEKDKTLIKWFTENGIEWDRNLISITRTCTAAGLGIVAKESVKQTGLNLVKIPRECILSPKNCGIADLIESSQLAGVLALTLALMFEMSLGMNSPWYGYLQSLPFPMEPIAAFWTTEQLNELQGTCLADIVKEQKAW